MLVLLALPEQMPRCCASVSPGSAVPLLAPFNPVRYAGAYSDERMPEDGEPEST